MMLACARCFHRQEAGETCGACGAEAIFDLRSQAARDLFDGNEARARRARDGRIRMISAITAVAAMVGLFAIFGALNLVPRRGAIVLVLAPAVGVELLLEKLLGRGKASILEGLPPAELP
ncbi:MAG: hypothetical protein K8W52_07055 [Deltaproteobacteria bacterium]|nr:hypothetical protein [Deltaproteobacteria bacterium]